MVVLGSWICPGLAMIACVSQASMFFNMQMAAQHPVAAKGAAVHSTAFFQSAAINTNVTDTNLEEYEQSPQSQPRQQQQAPQQRLYPEWREMAIHLAKLPPAQALSALHETDPFGVRTFAQKLRQAETAAAAAGNENSSFTAASTSTVGLAELRKLFPCPPSDQRMSLPDQRDHSKAKAYREGHGFLFFQHLRKAGGTHFCKNLAAANIPFENLPSFYCMPDYEWPPKKNSIGPPCASVSGCLRHWTNVEIVNYTSLHHHRIVANEFDAFDPQRHFELPAVFVTSFRQPVDRALSQFRFECVEERECNIRDVDVWWQERRDLHNIYTTTFSGTVPPPPVGDDDRAALQRGEVLGQALNVVAKFNLVLCTEWLAYAAAPLRTVLGFTNTSGLTKPVRPHNEQLQRNDTWIPEEYLTPLQYQNFSHHLALDEILTDAARRLFLERLVCEEPG